MPARTTKGGGGPREYLMISHGVIHTLPELCQKLSQKAQSMHNQSVRVLGR